MVQRTPANKFGVQTSDKGERRGVTSFKPTSSFCCSSSSSQNADGKNRAADLKKKMKKSRAIQQLSDFVDLNSSPVRKNVSLPGKPPPTNCSNVLEIKQSQNQPSPIRTSDGSPNYMKSTSCFDARKEGSRNSGICSDSKKPRRRSTENSNHVSVSGLKPTKCLTKCSSGKLVRTLAKTASFKKSSRVALCADMNSNRATCSSTLKDSKFPAYLMLSSGATESEGTSAMKVCPYTYCSLNGHRHAPLPPLKCFLSARRHLLKTQKNLKVEPSDCGVKRVDEEMTPEIFVEIYAENKVDGAGLVDQERVMNGDFVGVSSSTVDDESSNEEESKLVADNVYDGSMDSEVGLIEEVNEGIFFDGDEYDDDAGSTDTEMEEWEEQRFLSMESDGLDEVEDQSNGEIGGLLGEIGLYNGEIVVSGDVVDSKGVSFGTEEEFNEKSGDFEEQFYVGDSELNHHLDWEVEEASQVSESLSFDQLSYLEDAFDEMDATQADVERKAEIEYLELILNSELEAEVEETRYGTEEASNNDHGKQFDDANDGDDVTDGDYVKFNEGYCGIQEEVLQFDRQLPDHDLALQEDILNVHIDNQMESEKQLDDANHGDEAAEAENSGQGSSDKLLRVHLSDEQCQDISATSNKNSRAEQEETESSTVQEMAGIDEPSDSNTEETCLNESSVVPIDIVKGKDRANSSVKAAKSSRTAIDSSQELDISGKNWKLNRKSKSLEDESEDPRNFNPQEPNFLPLVPDPEAEKVDLKHQLIDDRRNAEEWMLDYALQRTVTKLAPAKKKKVALLVEAFESVMPTSRYEIHLQNNAPGAFTQTKRIQACF